ncbi:hypothetical protein K438DRAFT_1764752 [Mycena galopus ATCC 62051]|nr:hypothetical protein K438DRAFT_1764752 [Mycena galopus ATCC 62051]
MSLKTVELAERMLAWTRNWVVSTCRTNLPSEYQTLERVTEEGASLFAAGSFGGRCIRYDGGSCFTSFDHELPHFHVSRKVSLERTERPHVGRTAKIDFTPMWLKFGGNFPRAWTDVPL